MHAYPLLLFSRHPPLAMVTETLLGPFFLTWYSLFYVPFKDIQLRERQVASKRSKTKESFNHLKIKNHIYKTQVNS